MLLGSVDGSSNSSIILVKVVNLARATVHEFVSHIRGVISISCSKFGPLIISCGRDEHMRMFNLKTFKEIFEFRLNEIPLEMKVVDENLLYMTSRRTIEIYDTNLFNINFCTLSSSVSKLMNFPCQNLTGRILAKTTDGVVRFLSPTNARSITATLPLLETDIIEDIAYHRTLSKILFNY